jgi:hypothetical protein
MQVPAPSPRSPVLPASPPCTPLTPAQVALLPNDQCVSGSPEKLFELIELSSTDGSWDQFSDLLSQLHEHDLGSDSSWEFLTDGAGATPRTPASTSFPSRVCSYGNTPTRGLRGEAGTGNSLSASIEAVRATEAARRLLSNRSGGKLRAFIYSRPSTKVDFAGIFNPASGMMLRTRFVQGTVN